MAGNRRIFDEAMRQGTNYAWDGQWNKAVAEYERAIAEFPEEASAYTALGQALVSADRSREALSVYQRAARLTPDDPLALARVAELQEQTQDTAGAVQTWLLAAELHLRRRAVDAAVQVWQRIVGVAPDNVPAHERLAKAYAGMHLTRKAVYEYLALAAIFQQKGEVKKATAACQQALGLDSRNPDVLTALDALKHGRSVRESVDEKVQSMSYITLGPGIERGDRAKGPLDMTRQKALTDLADKLLEDNGVRDVGLTTALLQAIDLQSRGEVSAAIESYELAMRAGCQYASASFNLGMLYQDTLQFEKAIEQFERAAVDPDYALGVHLALGECLRALGRVDEAVTHFIQVLQQLELAVVGPENADGLQQAYGALLRGYETTEVRASAPTILNSLTAFLNDEYWEERLQEARRQLDYLASDRVISLAEILALPDSDRILTSMVRAREYADQNLLRSASEECLWAIERAPDYLPLHLHLARLFLESSQHERAIGKYLYVADTFAARGEMTQASALYERVLQTMPMDLEIRRKLIALLREHDQAEQALEHQLALADAYYELAQIETSREQYNQALRLAANMPDRQVWTARILHRVGDIDVQRLDWRSAIDVYRRLKGAVPDDDRARRRLVELYLNLERRQESVAELDELIRFYRDLGNPAQALELLDELIESHPDDLELRKRAAQLYVETGNKDGAVIHLDAMGELQLQNGQVREAAATIKAIIALGPDNIDAYRDLLEQIA